MRTAPFDPTELTRNGFLGGRVTILQPREGYRAGVDPVLLAATVPARARDRVLELGCGGGVGLSCLGTRVPGLHLTGVEIQPAYAALARDNLAAAGQRAEIHCANLTDLPPDLRKSHFDHVFANPPYFQAHRRSRARAADRETALAEDTPLSDWIAVAARRLAPRGTATFIQRAERLDDLLTAAAAHLGSLQVWPLIPRTGRDARLVLLRGRKGGGADLRLHAPLVLHLGTHDSDGGKDYAPAVAAALEQGAALPFPA